MNKTDIKKIISAAKVRSRESISIIESEIMQINHELDAERRRFVDLERFVGKYLTVKDKSRAEELWNKYYALCFDSAEKKCINCKKVKSLFHFYRQTGKPHGWTAYCKECSRKRFRNTSIEKKLAKYPGSYWNCVECDEYNKNSLKDCKFCGSKRSRNDEVTDNVNH